MFSYLEGTQRKIEYCVFGYKFGDNDIMISEKLRCLLYNLERNVHSRPLSCRYVWHISTALMMTIWMLITKTVVHSEDNHFQFTTQSYLLRILLIKTILIEYFTSIGIYCEIMLWFANYMIRTNISLTFLKHWFENHNYDQCVITWQQHLLLFHTFVITISKN